ncbi:MAG: CBS domain-containing protein, partial [Acidothermaceae bacterium]
MPLLNALDVVDYMSPPRVVFDDRESLESAVERLDSEHLTGAPVVDERGAFVGVVRRRSMPDDVEGEGSASVGRFADPAAPTTTSGEHLDSAL